MIISASYKTDIPTFYGRWFINRLREGWCMTVNPYNRKASKVSLRREDVEGFVFWTKNLNPFLGGLKEVEERGYPFVVQHTINGYPTQLEHSVVDAHSSVRALKVAADLFGRDTCVWRYDTIIITSLTSEEFHLKNFERLAQCLKGTVNEVVVSFMHLYAKTERNLNSTCEEHGISWIDPELPRKRSLLEKLVAIAGLNSMTLSVCSQRELLIPGANDARCVDAERLSKVSGKRFGANLKGNRKDCGCFESKDIGEYDTCPHGCVYCYAVRNQRLARERFKKHDSQSPYIFAPEFPVQEELPDSHPRLF